MKNRDKALIVATSVAITVLIVLLAKRQRRNKAQMLDSIAEEGYETAHDILYPLKSRGSHKLRKVFGR